MPDRAALSHHVGQALELTADGAALHKHTMWVVAELLDRLRPSDLTPAEMMAMNVILAAANARKLAKPSSPFSVVPIRPVGENIAG